jgi:hypothetical protein
VKNPPAFPGWVAAETGMTLRDYFAGKALAGLARHPHTGADPAEEAERAYRIADAMLAQREKA